MGSLSAPEPGMVDACLDADGLPGGQLPAVAVQGQTQGGGCAGIFQTAVRLHGGAAVGIQGSLNPDVHQMGVGRGKEGDGAEQSAHPPEILILQPAAGTEPVDPGHQLIFTGADQLGQIKLGGIKAAFRVTSKHAVAPQGQGAVGALKADAAALPGLGQNKGAAVLAGGVPALGDLARANGLMPVPGILLVDVLGRAKRIVGAALQLDVAGHTDLRPGGKVSVGAGRPAEVPQAVQGQLAAFPAAEAEPVGGMRRQASQGKDPGIGQHGLGKLHMPVSLSACRTSGRSQIFDLMIMAEDRGGNGKSCRPDCFFWTFRACRKEQRGLYRSSKKVYNIL